MCKRKINKTKLSQYNFTIKYALSRVTAVIILFFKYFQITNKQILKLIFFIDIFY